MAESRRVPSAPKRGRPPSTGPIGGSVRSGPRADPFVEQANTTFVDIRYDDESTWTYYRYIDYIGALHQLGVPTVSRPIVTTPDDGTTDASEFE